MRAHRIGFAVLAVLLATGCGSNFVDTAHVSTDQSKYNPGDPVAITGQVVTAGAPEGVEFSFDVTLTDTFTLTCHHYFFFDSCVNGQYDVVTNDPTPFVQPPGVTAIVGVTVADPSGTHTAGEEITACHASDDNPCTVSGDPTDEKEYEVLKAGVASAPVVAPRPSVHVTTRFGGVPIGTSH